MSQCIKALRLFFENCTVALYQRREDGKRYMYQKPFTLHVEWEFTKDDEYEKETPYFNGVNNDCLFFHGTCMFDDRGEQIWDNEFSGGPFVIPPGGGSINCDYSKVKIGPYATLDLFAKLKKRRLRKLSLARIERLRKVYDQYGEINGWGIEFNKQHEDAIAIYYESAKNLNKAPKFFESWPVVCHLNGPIRLDSKKKKKEKVK